MITETELISCLGRYWGLPDADVTVHDGGMGSRTWFVDLGARRWVAKAVAPADGPPLAAGLAIARNLEASGIPAGAPVPAPGGQLAVELDDGWLALLRWVPGHALTGQDDAERALIGRTLARVHRALTGYTAEAAQRFHWVDPDAGYLSLRPWLRPAIIGALNNLGPTGPGSMTWGLLHADPAPEAFRLDPATGQCGVIDWSYALEGPLLYDLASAVMYAGGTNEADELIRAYLSESTIGPGEAARGLEPMLRFRWAVQANYFAWRISENNLTGIAGPEDNEKGLEDARQFLTA